MLNEFDRDPQRAGSNRRKYGVVFERAGVFADPLALSWLDEVAGEGEERWVTIGGNAARTRHAPKSNNMRKVIR